ncbi:MAG: bifunctional 23S rRNA (guanine(2069)-N(7))-methyltransferase RlmK/23S rRNA (guanine(2445)-N(2))-methyltransferase RlmL [Deltaproteobacteria bacterium]|nr:bifunctional 23S rRNA (guanine(2069)-N(7))-methyltransferase RlmK/23S rRNA (guanine(2445)-N(2))-methyltransferase RlmL [Deltaproteobacteria bacterium]
MSGRYDLFATCARQLEPLLLAEIQALGGENAAEARAGVAFQGDLEVAYRACLWSRLSSRVLLSIAGGAATDTDALYALGRQVPWDEHMALDRTFAIDVTLVRSGIHNSQFAAQRFKDAIVDIFREKTGARPDVDTASPDLRLNVHVKDDLATVSVDLAGDSLHRRGYRERAGEAPLKESLAAALLMRAGWAEAAAAGKALVDPMCGSGTLLIEAALIASDTAPGLARERFGFMGWRQHRPDVWQALHAEARTRRRASLPVVIAGYDVDPGLVRLAAKNIERAGFKGQIKVGVGDIASAAPPPEAAGQPGLVVVNPPYGERLGDVESLKSVYAGAGLSLRQRFAGWSAFVLVGHEELGLRLGLRAQRRWVFFNGSMKCWLLQIGVPTADSKSSAKASEGSAMLKNRLEKNLRHLRKFARQVPTDCFRVYDADLAEYAAAIDLYGDWVVVSEYEAPPTVDPVKAGARLGDVMAVVPEVFGVPREKMIVKVRRRRKGGVQYEKLEHRAARVTVHERDCVFLVNLTDYVDTGLFLDQRPTRALIRDQAAGRRFLNLFAYTGTATVAAAKGGAKQTTTVDMSGTYLDWAADNLRANGFRGREHELVQADCLRWLESAHGPYDLIFLDPPTYSSSKRMTETFDVQRDHVDVIRRTLQSLAADGTLLFSCNFQRFKLDREALADLSVEDISKRTIDPDFARQPRIHRVFRIRRS